MFITAEIQKTERLSDREVEHLEKMLQEIDESSGSMTPEIWKAKSTVELDSTMGGQSLEGSLFSKSQLADLKKLGKRLFNAKGPAAKNRTKREIYAIVRDYVEYHRPEQLWELEVKSSGWMAHLTMPGYMDQTEPTRYESFKAAVEGLYQEFGENSEED
jgi:hypothetical protein